MRRTRASKSTTGKRSRRSLTWTAFDRSTHRTVLLLRRAARTVRGERAALLRVVVHRQTALARRRMGRAAVHRSHLLLTAMMKMLTQLQPLPKTARTTPSSRAGRASTTCSWRTCASSRSWICRCSHTSCVTSHPRSDTKNAAGLLNKYVQRLGGYPQVWRLETLIIDGDMDENTESYLLN